MRRIGRTIISVSIVLLLFLSACQNNTDPVGDEERLSGKLRIAINRGTIIGSGYVHPLDESTKGPIYDKLRGILKQHPDLEIELIDISFMTDEPSTIPQEPLPDIIEVVPYQIQWVAGVDELENLDPVVQISGWNESYAKLVDRTRLNGTARMLPIKSEPMIVFYDERVFGQLNIAVPHEGWTWDDFVAASEKLNAEGYVTDIPDEFDAVEHIIKGLGGAYTSEDGTRFIQYLDSESTVSAFERYVSDMRVQQFNGVNKSSPIALGMGRPSELYSLLDENIDLRITRMPLFADGNRYNTMLTTGLAIAADSPNKSAAVELLKALAGDNEDEAVRFANYNALAMKNPRYNDKPLVQQDELLRIMKLETADSVPATFQLNPEAVNHYGILNKRPKEFAEVFPTLFEQDSAEPTLKKLSSMIETLFQAQRGNW
ncbi:ABC transporter substrate-binding protein [Paenibacillus harenae]|uniref:ABC transporter substrate-binding protein n=1 Tax=Paenibacillus harenae TaxID=306543 RepID=UPI00278CE09B|nr:extracellular solute-binding protein [Paenibacillus harenae]MDQ0063163.1 multiple sugar transport system substrate-binding protein [Paenibacillus harenae]